MSAFPVTLLYGPVIVSSFPGTLRLGVIAIAVFGIELAIARLVVHPRKGLYALVADCLAVGMVLGAWCGYFTLYGSSFTSGSPTFLGGAHMAYYDFYRSMWKANEVIFPVAGVLMLVTWIVLITQRGRRA